LSPVWDISCLAELIYYLIRQFLCGKVSQTGDDSIILCGKVSQTGDDSIIAAGTSENDLYAYQLYDDRSAGNSISTGFTSIPKKTPSPPSMLGNIDQHNNNIICHSIIYSGSIYRFCKHFM